MSGHVHVCKGYRFCLCFNHFPITFSNCYDKRDDFNFKIINFPNMCSNIPASPAYGVYISQLIRYARASSNISWNVIFIWETDYWTRAIKRFALFDLLKSLYSDNKILSKYILSLQRQWWTMSKIFLSMCDVGVFLTFTFVVKILQGTRSCWWRWLTIDVSPSSLDLVLRWLLFCLFCSSIVINAVIVTAGTFDP